MNDGNTETTVRQDTRESTLVLHSPFHAPPPPRPKGAIQPHRPPAPPTPATIPASTIPLPAPLSTLLAEGSDGMLSENRRFGAGAGGVGVGAGAEDVGVEVEVEG